MTVTLATTSPLLVGDVHPARGRSRLCDAGCQTTSEQIAAPTCTADDATHRGGIDDRDSSFVRSAQ
jgi:hypothetical protein